MIAPGRLGTPATAKRAAARCRHVEAEIAMRLLPGHTITLQIDQVPSRKWRFDGGREQCVTALGVRAAPVCSCHSEQTFTQADDRRRSILREPIDQNPQCRQTL